MVIDQLLDSFVQNAELLESALATLPESLKTTLGAVVAGKLLDRFERTGSIHDLDRAITTMERAVACTLDDHPDCAMYLNKLGECAAEEI